MYKMQPFQSLKMCIHSILHTLRHLHPTHVFSSESYVIFFFFFFCENAPPPEFRIQSDVLTSEVQSSGAVLIRKPFFPCRDPMEHSTFM